MRFSNDLLRNGMSREQDWVVSLNILSALMVWRAIGAAETNVPADGLKSWVKAWVLTVLSVSAHRAVQGGQGP